MSDDQEKGARAAANVETETSCHLPPVWTVFASSKSQQTCEHERMVEEKIPRKDLVEIWYGLVGGSNQER